MCLDGRTSLGETGEFQRLAAGRIGGMTNPPKLKLFVDRPEEKCSIYVFAA